MSEANVKTPFFSVVIPTHNRPVLLERAIRSVLDQTFRDYEIIVVNDGSTCSYEAFVDQYGTSIQSYQSFEKAKGVSYARNQGISLARADWIIFLDDDDEFCIEYFQELYQRIAFSKDVPEFLWTGIERNVYVNHSSNPTVQIINYSHLELPEEFITAASSVGISYGVAVKKNLFDRYGGFDESMQQGEDTELIIRLLSKYISVGVVGHIGVRKHAHQEGRLSEDFRVYSFDRVYEKIIERYADFLMEQKSLYLSILKWAYYVHKRSKNYGALRDVLLSIRQLETHELKKINDV